MSMLSQLRSRFNLGKLSTDSRTAFKYSSELEFKKDVILQQIAWYRGELAELYGERSPTNDVKIRVGSERDNAILTWAKVHQEPKYLEDLDLMVNAFDGMRLLDIGSSAVPSALCFKNCEVFCLEPLLPDQLKLHYPFWAYEQRARFVFGFAEAMPFPNSFFDAVISVNALDHVDDLATSVKEIRRVSKPNAKFRFHMHYHKASATEPIELNDAIVERAFVWCQNFHKHSESKKKRGSTLAADSDESFCVWSNF